MSDSLGLGGGSGDSGAVDDIDNVDDGDFNADLNTDDDVGNGSFAYFLAADQVDGDTIGDRGNGDGVGSLRQRRRQRRSGHRQQLRQQQTQQRSIRGQRSLRRWQ